MLDVHVTGADLRAAMERDVRSGLTVTPKCLPPVYFYDDRGSQLFDAITRLPEYYPTRAERGILERSAKEMAELAAADTLVELGAGTCEKTRLLLDAMATTGRLTRYVPFDVSATTIERAAGELASEYPGLAVHAVAGDFHRHLGHIPDGGDRLFAFLGGTIGNLDPDQRRAFLTDLGDVLSTDDRLLLGTDLVKDRGRLLAAYDDAAGVTAKFNRNVLHVLNRELRADFVPDAFSHAPRWNEDDHRIEMWLRAEGAQRVHIGSLDLDITFADGEELLTEISTKFTPDGLANELASCGFELEAQWLADDGAFLVTLSRPSR